MAATRHFDLIREMRSAHNHRLRLVESAREPGSKPTTRLFATTTIIVRKCWRRFRQHGLCRVQEHSRAPHGSPQKTLADIEERVVAPCRDLPTLGAARPKQEFDLPIAHMALQRIWHAHELLKKCRRKSQRKQHLAHIKARWAPFQQISADTKDLGEIPHNWPQAQRLYRGNATAQAGQLPASLTA